MFVASVLLLCVPLAAMTGIACLGTDFYNQLRIECVVRSEGELSDLHQMADELQADVWDEHGRAFPALLTIRIHKNQYGAFKQRFHCPQIAPLPVPQPLLEKRFRLLEDFFSDFRSFADQEAFLKTLAKANTAKAKLSVIGKSLEGRPLYVLHLSNDFANTGRKAIWVNGGQHAREWLSPAACLFLAQHALANASSFLAGFNLLIAPNLNPDGYEWSRYRDRYWRKNKRKNRDGSVGVDLNRNWDFKWNQVNGGGATYSEVYPGTGPASEPEVSATAAFILANRESIVAGIDVHTYGEMVLRNYGWKMDPCPDETLFKQYGDAMATAAQQIANEPYQSQRSAGLYPTSGSLDDWFYVKAGFPGFTFEMRDGGRYGFVVPAAYIVPNGQELVAAINALMAQLPRPL